jgi:putative hydrolase of the HAD superfamily
MTSQPKDTSGETLTIDIPATRRGNRKTTRGTVWPVVAFDGDDTLWHNESIFSITQEKYRALLAEYVDKAELDRRLYATETRNLRFFGYGVKGFTLSMIETAIDVSDGRVPAHVIQTIVDEGKAMIDHPVELLQGVRRTLAGIRRRCRLVLITKGDLFDQESKLARSGLADLFWKVEIVSQKDERTYRRILSDLEVSPRRFVMVGNSVRSDILPVVAIGARAIHVPYHITWAHEQAEMHSSNGARSLSSIEELPDVLVELFSEEPPLGLTASG